MSADSESSEGPSQPFSRIPSCTNRAQVHDGTSFPDLSGYGAAKLVRVIDLLGSFAAGNCLNQLKELVDMAIARTSQAFGSKLLREMDPAAYRRLGHF
jgi:hypothetical protein